ncbi:hypothetical protein GCM10007071_24130 [Marinobacter zhanjiangensis]|uniref:Uncharacterized protein n=1 Tax=Marinobacter zhanjiangensis TaxID=578215 RepID=A0ABQ3B372_9GAMM|nr:hypothetical protein GCM10007071_24130 [Marinobacter zhanjiangensis]
MQQFVEIEAAVERLAMPQVNTGAVLHMGQGLEIGAAGPVHQYRLEWLELSLGGAAGTAGAAGNQADLAVVEGKQVNQQAGLPERAPVENIGGFLLY